jgi:hypothetical protein
MYVYVTTLPTRACLCCLLSYFRLDSGYVPAYLPQRLPGYIRYLSVGLFSYLPTYGICSSILRVCGYVVGMSLFSLSSCLAAYVAYLAISV